MLIKTEDLIGLELDYAVEMAINKGDASRKAGDWLDNWLDPERRHLCKRYSSDSSLADEIIEKEGYTVEPFKDKPDDWRCYDFKVGEVCYGPTPQVAGLRCFVMIALGEEMDIPAELKQLAQPGMEASRKISP